MNDITRENDGVRLLSPYIERLDLLIEKFEAMDGGFLHMPYWVIRPCDQRDPEEFLRQARTNPCGTAACIAGKAGFMAEFEEMGYRVVPLSTSGKSGFWFSIEPKIFFGLTLYNAVLVGHWAVENIHIPAQAAAVLRAFKADLGRAWRAGYTWTPQNALEIKSMFDPGAAKTWPVTGYVQAHGEWVAL